MLILFRDILLVPLGVFTSAPFASWEQHQSYIAYIFVGLMADYSFIRPNARLPRWLKTYLDLNLN